MSAGRGIPIALLGLSGVFSFTGCQPQTPLTPEQQAGKHLYEVRCAHCHEENDLNLKPAPPSLHHIGEQGILPNGGAATDAAIVNVVNGGKGKMPAFRGRFNEEQMNYLVAYLRTGLK